MLNSYCIPTRHMLNTDCVDMRLKEEYVCILIDLKNCQSYVSEDIFWFLFSKII